MIQDDFDKDNRRERYQRKRGKAPTSISHDSPKKRRTPYKREQINYDQAWEEDLDEWFDDNNI